MVRFIARIFALLAIAAVAVGIYVIVHDNVRTLSGSTHHHRRHAHHHRHRTHQHPTPPRKPVIYVVKAGDTLSAILGKTHVSLVTITKLNPSLKPPYSLTTGEKLRLRK
jgi:LysM repeat protein